LEVEQEVSVMEGGLEQHVWQNVPEIVAWEREIRI
jgi:hypothetical protein